jgi:hypothetical protein
MGTSSAKSLQVGYLHEVDVKKGTITLSELQKCDLQVSEVKGELKANGSLHAYIMPLGGSGAVSNKRSELHMKIPDDLIHDFHSIKGKDTICVLVHLDTTVFGGKNHVRIEATYITHEKKTH